MQYGLKKICRNCQKSDGVTEDYDAKACRVDWSPICANKRCRCRFPDKFVPKFKTIEECREYSKK